MIIAELELSPRYKLNQVVRVLENVFNITIDFDAVENSAELKSIYEEYELIRKQIIRETQYNSYNENPDYTKACLIQEAISIFLREIAPGRRSRKNSARGAEI